MGPKEQLRQAQHEHPVRVSDFDFILRVRSIDPPNPADFSVSSLITSSGAIARDAAPLAPTKALKTGVRATPHTAPQPLPVVDIVAEAAKLQGGNGSKGPEGPTGLSAGEQGQRRLGRCCNG